MTTRKRSHPLKLFRQAHGLNQRAAAKQFGVSQAAWSRWERGEQRPGRAMAKRLMRETGAALDVLMGVAS